MIPGIVAQGAEGAAGPSPSGDPYFANVVSLLHLDGANGSTAFTDVTGKAWTPVGGAAISTTQSKFGGASFASTASNYIHTPQHADFAFGAGDFTFEFWCYPTSLGGIQIIYDHRTSASQPRPTVYLNGTTIIYFASGGNRNTIAGLSNNAWNHLAVARASGTTRMFLNGIKSASDFTDVITYEASRIALGTAGNSPGGEGFIGFVDEVRVTKGIARYTAAFTPPTEPFPDS